MVLAERFQFGIELINAIFVCGVSELSHFSCKLHKELLTTEWKLFIKKSTYPPLLHLFKPFLSCSLPVTATYSGRVPTAPGRRCILCLFSNDCFQLLYPISFSRFQGLFCFRLGRFLPGRYIEVRSNGDGERTR